jgi:hypothetical protein
MNEHALQVLKDGLSKTQTFNDRYDIIEKIMSLAFNPEGNCVHDTFKNNTIKWKMAFI